MANNNRKPKSYVSLVDQNVGTDDKGNPVLVFRKGQPIEGLTQKQAKFYKSKGFIK